MALLKKSIQGMSVCDQDPSYIGCMKEGYTWKKGFQDLSVWVKDIKEE